MEKPRMRVCAGCGESFARPVGQVGNPPKRCPSCRKNHLTAKWASEGVTRRALTSTASAEVFAKEEVFERDGWSCGICGGEVDRTLQWPDPGSASLDHKVPISRGGDHTRQNSQCTHLGCNNRKQAKSEGQPVVTVSLPAPVGAPPRGPHKTPLDYMMGVMNDPAASELRRDRMAQAAAPYMHPRIEKVVHGKKVAAAEAAEVAAKGRYAPRQAPRIGTETIQ